MRHHTIRVMPFSIIVLQIKSVENRRKVYENDR